MSSMPDKPLDAEIGGTMPLVVDLDGTLIKSDLLLESANRFVTAHPTRLLRLAGWLAAGRSTLKARLAESADIDAGSLPYNEAVVKWLRDERERGRKLVLATASHRLLAEAVAAHLGLFDEVLATEADLNLKSEAKRDLLIERYGLRQFEYVGNDKADLPVWSSAARCHIVSSSADLIGKVRDFGRVGEIFAAGKRSSTGSLRRALRVHQWVKNILIFVPLLAAHLAGSYSSLLQVMLAFVAFSMTASSVYLLNDLVDLADDRHHIRKRNRPFAAGDLSLLQGWLMWPALLVLAFAMSALALPWTFSVVLVAYFAVTLAYSFRLKRLVMVDVLCLALLYTARIVAGSAAAMVPLSFWLLAFSTFIFLSLAFMKRFSELKAERLRGRSGKLRGRGYQDEDLELVSGFGTSAAYVSVLVLALYIQDGRTAQLYHQPKVIWLACPFLLFWLSRAWLIAHRGQMHDDPIVFALRDRTSLLIGLTMAVIFLLAMVL